MNIKKLTERLLIFLLGVPGLLGACYFFPYYNFLAMHIIVYVAVLLGSLEIRNLFVEKFEVYNKLFHFICVTITMIFVYLYGLNIISLYKFIVVLVALIFFMFTIEIVLSEVRGFKKSIERLSSGIFVLVYPVYLSLWFLFILHLEHARTTSMIFFMAVFACDSMAWLVGMTLGRGNKGYLKVSPNKSIAGFFGGIFGSVIAALIAFTIAHPFSDSLPKTIFLVVVTGIVSILGDLFESLLKRSVDIKDSGTVVMGRGGIMDSIDSLLFAAPVFYILYRVLF